MRGQTASHEYRTLSIAVLNPRERRNFDWIDDVAKEHELSSVVADRCLEKRIERTPC